MTISEKREKLHDYINTADDEKVEVIFSIIEGALEEKYDHWEDAEFLAEVKTRIDDIESGKVKCLSWEEVKLKARSVYKEKHALMKQASSDPLFLADIKSVSDDFASID